MEVPDIVMQSSVEDTPQEPVAESGLQIETEQAPQEKDPASEVVKATQSISPEVTESESVVTSQIEMAANSMVLEMVPDMDLSQVQELHIEIIPEALAESELGTTSQAETLEMDNPSSSKHADSKNQRGSYLCGICHKDYPWKWSLKRHMLQSHYVKSTEDVAHDLSSMDEEPQYFVCDLCNKAYAYEENMILHKQRDHQDEMEEVNEAEVGDARPMETGGGGGSDDDENVVVIKTIATEAEQKAVLLDPQSLEDVGKEVKKSQSPKKATRSTTSTSVLCDFCAEIFPSTLTWQSHKCKEQEHGRIADRTFVAAEDFISEEAEMPKEFTDIPLELEQLLQMAEGNPQDYVEKVEDDYEDQRDSKEKVPFLFPCGHCDRWYPTQITLREHLKLAHNVESIQPLSTRKRRCEDGEYACDLCDNRYRYKRGLVEHVKEHRCEFDKYIIEDQRRLAKLKDPSEYLCDVCGIVSVSKDSLRHHLRSHEKDMIEVKQFLCELCGLNYQSKREKRLHLKTHKVENAIWKCQVCAKTFPTNRTLLIQTHKNSHTGEKPFECEICGKKLLRRCHLQSHLKKHESEKTIYVYECGECGKRFRQRSHLKVHIMSHNGEKPHECPDCGKRFLMHSHMKYHQRTVHAIVKPANFTCDQCGQLFVHKHHYKTHMMRHSGEKPYECERCGKRFIQRSHLKTHIMTHTGEKPHECDHCGKRFLMSSHLKSHIISVHTMEKAFACGVCGKKCPTHGQFKAHMKIHARRGVTARRYKLATESQIAGTQQWSSPLEVLSSIIVDSNNQFGTANIIPMSESNSHVEVEVLSSIQSIVPEQSSQVESQIEVTSSAVGDPRQAERMQEQGVEVVSGDQSMVSVYHPGSGAKIDPSSCILIIPESGSEQNSSSGFRILPEMNSEDQPTSAILISHNVPRSSVTLEPSTMRGAYIISESDFDGETDSSSRISIAGGEGSSSLRIVRETEQESSTIEVVPEIQMEQEGAQMEEDSSDQMEQTTTIYVDEEGNPIDPSTTASYFPVQETGTYLASASQLESGSTINVVLESDPLDAKTVDSTLQDPTLESGQTVVYVTEPDTKYMPPTVVTSDSQVEEGKTIVYMQGLEEAGTEVESKSLVYMQQSGQVEGNEEMTQIIYVAGATAKNEPGAISDSGAELEAAQTIIYVSESCGQIDQSLILGVESDLSQVVKTEVVDSEKSG
jgi:KRAB domain-containing zinc finger protein